MEIRYYYLAANIGPCQMILQRNSLQEGGEAVMSGGLPLTMTAEECQNRCRQDEHCKVSLVHQYPLFTVLRQIASLAPCPKNHRRFCIYYVFLHVNLYCSPLITTEDSMFASYTT